MAINDAIHASTRFGTKTVKSFEVTVFAAFIAVFGAFIGGNVYAGSQGTPASAETTVSTIASAVPTTAAVPKAPAQ